MSRALAGAALALVLAALAGCAPSPDQIILATTTSVRDSGLMDELLPHFREATGFDVDVIAVGTGAALRMGVEGNADVLLTHAPPAEIELVQAGKLASRREFMENHFSLAGPEADPAGVRGSGSAAEAYRRLAAANAPYVSRGDDSGTHKKEQALLAAAGLPTRKPWGAVESTGSGMGLTLQVAGERRAYTLADLGTFLAFRERIGLTSLLPPSDDLRNVYSVLQLSSERQPGVDTAGGRALEEFLLSPATQARIASFGVERFGEPLFRPLAPADGQE